MSDTDLKPLPELENEIRQWLVQKSMGKPVTDKDNITASATASTADEVDARAAPHRVEIRHDRSDQKKESNDDLYDF